MANDDEAERRSRDGGSAAHNPPNEDDAVERRIQQQPTVAPGSFVRKAVIALVLLVVAFVVYQISAAFFPRWWSQRVADQVQGRFIAGTTWGLFYGFVFTVVPLMLLVQIRRGFFSWKWRGVVALVAVVLAAPNWLTLSVVAGNSKAARAGERIMDVDAPNFRVATLIGAIVAAALVVVITAVTMRAKRRKDEVRRLKGERDELRRGRDN